MWHRLARRNNRINRYQSRACAPRSDAHDAATCLYEKEGSDGLSQLDQTLVMGATCPYNKKIL